MKQISISLDDEMVEKVAELAELWGLPEVRHNSAVFSRCLERIWMLEIGCKQYQSTEENGRSIDNAQ